MMHILWIVLIILGILLGIVLLGVCLVLFCPVRYRAEGRIEELSWSSIRAAVSVSWLLGIFSFRIRIQDGSLGQTFRIAGISVKKARGEQHKKKKRQREISLAKEQEMQESAEGVVATDEPEMKKNAEDTATVKETERMLKPGTEKGIPAKRREFVGKRLGNRIKHFFQTLASFPKKCRSRLEIWTFTIKKNYGRMSWWKEFLADAHVQKAFLLIKSKGMVLLHHVFPTNIQGNLMFGCADPSLTGGLTAILGMSFPLHKNRVQVTPVFNCDENFVQGDVRLRGRVYGIVLLKTAIEVYFNKEARYLLWRWKNKEDKKNAK